MKVSFEKVSAIALDEVSKSKYLYFNQMTGVIGTILDRAGVEKINPIPEDYFIAIKNAISDEFHGGMEPEFETKEQFEKWENINSDHYLFITVEETKTDPRFRHINSPFKDKKIPFLASINNVWQA